MKPFFLIFYMGGKEILHNLMNLKKNIIKVIEFIAFIEVIKFVEFCSSSPFPSPPPSPRSIIIRINFSSFCQRRPDLMNLRLFLDGDGDGGERARATQCNEPNGFIEFNEFIESNEWIQWMNSMNESNEWIQWMSSMTSMNLMSFIFPWGKGNATQFNEFLE